MADPDIKVLWSHSKKVSHSVDELVPTVVKEITCIVNGKTVIPTHKSLFFKLVRGGNVTVVRKILQYMYWHGLTREIKWATGKPIESKLMTPQRSIKVDGPEEEDLTVKEHVLSSGAKRLLFVILIFLFILTSPVFYAIHSALYQLDMKRNSVWDSKDLQLPLIYALLSEETEMVELFLDYGCSLESQDSEGNNVYHHLAKMSVLDNVKALRCHKLISTFSRDNQTLAYVVTEQENQLGYNAWEYTAKYGSLHMCCQLARDKCGFAKQVLGVSRDKLWANVPEEFGPESGCRREPEDGEFNVWEFDISRYETGSAHSRQSYPLQLIVNREVEKLHEVDVTAVLSSKFISQWMSIKMKAYIVPCIFSHLMGIILTLLFLIHIVHRGGDMTATPLFDFDWLSENYINQLSKVKHEVDEHNKTIPSFDPETQQYQTDSSSVESCLFELHQLERDSSDDVLWVDHCHYKLIKTWQQRCNEKCNCTMSESAVFSHLFPVSQPEEAIVWDTLNIILVIIGVSTFMDISSRLVFLKNNFNWCGKRRYDVMVPLIARRIPGSYIEKQVNVLMYFVFAIGMLLNHFHDHVFQHIAEENDKLFSLAWHNSTEDKRYHLEHAKELLNMFTTKDSLHNTVSKLIIVCLLLRFLHFIFVLRLMPSIGFFILTAKKMANHLIQFAVVFLIVSLAFGTIFYFIMRNPDCPAKKIEGFQSLLSSLFSAYQVSLGYGELDFSQNLNARLAYVAFTVIVIVLLMNLIIAVMTTTVEDINQSPWKEALNQFELWDEILSIEQMILVILYPFKFLTKCKHHPAKKKTTFEVIHWKNGTYFE